MNPSEIPKILQSLKINPDEISDKKAAETIRILLQIIETLYEENQALKAELQKMRDELNQLKGEQGKPKFPHIKRKQSDFSSENERKSLNPPGETKSKEKLSKIKIDFTEVCKVDPIILPEDAEFKGYQTVIVQEISINTKNTAYKKEIYFLPPNTKLILENYQKGLKESLVLN
jgi:FtsZ-binding cell division protein ZapB